MLLVVSVCLFSVMTGCSSGGSGNQVPTSPTTGSIAVKLAWGSVAKTSSKSVASVPADVATVRISISAPDISSAVQKDFPAVNGSGTVDGVPAGAGRTVTALGINANGILAYRGTAANISVQGGQTTDAGTITMAAAAPAVFNGTVVLGSPTATSINANIFSADQDGMVFLTYGTSSGVYDKQTGTYALAAGEPLVLAVDGLAANTRYYYRLSFRASGSTDSTLSEEHMFHTARATGSTFTFTIQADSHLDENSDLTLYLRALGNVTADVPDFHVDLGDTFMCEKYSAPLTASLLMAPDQATVNARYRYERANFGTVASSAPLFLVNGNHEGEAGWLADGSAQNIAVWTALARKKYYENPVPGSFYSGDSSDEPFIGKRASWYSWQWGDALFVVLDPFWNSKIMASRDPWALTLGEAQYKWLQQTLSASSAKFKFIFIHNLVGGLDGQMRGGIEAAPYFEWGGNNLDGTVGFLQKRPGWSMSIHQLLVRYRATAVFHGHDHLYAKQELDGVVYQEVPQPSAKNFSSGSSLALQYHYLSGTILSSSGHLRVTVAPAGVTVQYVRAWLPANETAQRINRQVDDVWSVVAP